MEFEVDKLSDEQLQAAEELLLQEKNTREVRKMLPERDEVGKVHEAIEKAAQKLGVDSDDIRIVEMTTFMGDFPGIIVQVDNGLEQWFCLSNSLQSGHPA